jgi:hypothetical protein
VGSGKTMLMDLFYDALPSGVHKTRIHFHDFMLSVHRRLRTLNNVADPLAAVAEVRGGVYGKPSCRALIAPRAHARSLRARTSLAAATWCSAWTSSWCA